MVVLQLIQGDERVAAGLTRKTLLSCVYFSVGLQVGPTYECLIADLTGKGFDIVVNDLNVFLQTYEISKTFTTLLTCERM